MKEGGTMNRLPRQLLGLVGALAMVGQPTSVVASTASVTAEQASAGFVRAGYEADSAIHWESSGLTTFFVRDGFVDDLGTERVLLVLVYPDTAHADEQHRLAHVQEEGDVGSQVAFGDDLGPELIPGYGRSAWWANIAVVQAIRPSSPPAGDTALEQIVPATTYASRRAHLAALGGVDADFLAVLRGLTIQR
jgi:hypothetical protein